MRKELEDYLKRGETGVFDFIPRNPNSYPFCGVGWYSRDFVNTCATNGFLTAFLIEVRLSKCYLLDEIRINDRVFQRLKELSQHVLDRGNTIDDFYCKKIWFEDLLGPNFFALPKPIDVRGHEVTTVFQHLLNHGGFNIQVTCACGLQVIKTPHLTVREHDEFLNLQNVLHGISGSYPSLAKCLTCYEGRRFIGISSIGYPWFFHVLCSGMDIEPVQRFEQSLEFQGERYDLAYLSIVEDNHWIRMCHQTTLHFLEGQWYYFDSQDSHSLLLMETVTNIQWSKRRLTGVTYFKRTYRGPGFHPLP